MVHLSIRLPVIPRRRVMILAPGSYFSWSTVPLPSYGLVHMMTARKRVGPLSVQQLAVRHPIDHSSSDYFSLDDSAQDFSSDSSSEASSDFHSDASSDSFSRHSLSDHSSPDLPSTSVRPSRKRRRSLMTSVPALSPVFGALSLVCADLIPSPKRVRDSSYLADIKVDPKETSLRDDVIVRGSDEPHLEQDIEPEIEAEIEECIPYADALRDTGIDTRVVVEVVDRKESETGTRGLVKVRVEKVTHLVMPEGTTEPAQEERAIECMYETLGSLVQRFHDHTVAIPVNRVYVIEGVQREQGRRIVGVESAALNMPDIRSGPSMTQKEVEELVTRRVAEEMEAREAAMNLEPLNENEDEQEGENDRNRNGGNGGNGNRNGRNGENVNGNRENRNGGKNKNGNRNGNGNHGMNYRGFMPVARECTFQDFLKCKPHNFSGTDGFRTIGVDAAYAMKWAGLMKLMTEVYCPGNEIQKIKTELYNLTVKRNDLTTYTQRFQELIWLCTRMVPNEEDKVERFIGGSCTVRCGNYKRVGHQTRDYRSAAAATNTQRAVVKNQSGIVCYECRRPGYFRKNCPKLRNQNLGNQTGNKTTNKTGSNEATTKANVVTGMFLLNRCYASMLFDSGADRSFVSSTFSTLLDVAPSTLDTSYAVELGDGRISKANIILRGCTLGLLGHPFDIDLMPVELESFNVIIGMDWTVKNYAMIICDEKVVRIPYRDEVLIIQSSDIDSRSKLKLNIISCTRTQKYIEKGCQFYLAQVMSKKEEDKSEERRLEDVPIIREFPEVFLEDLPGQPPA
nr:reverse transcriptase domain-containing protein [Tanacetum cinerariifolium]